MGMGLGEIGIIIYINAVMALLGGRGVTPHCSSVKARVGKKIVLSWSLLCLFFYFLYNICSFQNFQYDATRQYATQSELRRYGANLSAE